MTSVVRITTKLVPARRKHAGDRLMTVNFAIIRDNEPPVDGNHRLMSGRGQIDDRQSAMDKYRPGFRIGPYSLVIWAAMPQAYGHRLRDIVYVTVRLSAVGADKSCDATH